MSASGLHDPRRGSQSPTQLVRPTTEWTGLLGRVLSTDGALAHQLQDEQWAIEHLNRRMSAATTDLIYVFDQIEQRAVYANRQLTTLLGYTAAESQAMGSAVVPELLHPDDLARLLGLSASWEAAGDEDVIEIEYRLRHRDGGWRWVHDRSVVLARTAEGRPCQILGVVQDITDRQAAEAALRESEARAHRQAQELTLLDRVRTALARETALPPILHAVVEGVAETFGYQLVSIYLRDGDVLRLQHQVGYDEVIETVPVTRGISGQVARTGRPVLLVDVTTNPDFLAAIPGLCSEVCVPIVVEGETVGIFNVETTGDRRLGEDDLRLLTAVSEHVSLAVARGQIFEALRTSEQRNRALIDQSPDAIHVLDLDVRQLVDVNEHTIRLFGYSRAELLAFDAAVLSAPEQVDGQPAGPLARHYIKQTLAGGTPTFEWLCRDRAGQVIPCEARLVRLPDPSRRLIRVSLTDIRDRKRVEAHQRLLAEFGNVATSLDYQTTLTNVARLAVPALADWCMVDLLEPDGQLVRVTAVHAIPEREALLELGLRYPAAPGPHDPLLTTVSQGHSLLINDPSEADLTAMARGPERLDSLRRLGIRSALVAPLVARGQMLGVLHLCSGRESERRYGPADLALAEEVARRAALAIDNARLYAAEQQARQAAELAQQRLQFLAQASAVLAGSLDYQTTLAAVARLSVPVLADYCLIDLVADTGQLERIIAIHANPACQPLVDELRRFPTRPDSTTPIARAFRTGQPQFILEVTDARLAAAARSAAGQVEVMRALGLRSALVMPLLVRGRTLGVIVLAVTTESGRLYGPAEQATAEELAHRAALAIDNALLYGEAQAALRRAELARAEAEASADRVARLQAVTAALNTALTPAQVADIILAQAAVALGALTASLVQLDPDGRHISAAGSIGLPATLAAIWHHVPLATPALVAEAIRSGSIVEVGTWAEREARYPDQAAALAGLGVEAGIAVPLLLPGSPLGAIVLGFAGPRQFTDEERAFLWALAAQAAQALERARLYAEAESTLAALRQSEAQLVQAAKLAAVGTLASGVAHELNQPLTVIRGQAQLLQATTGDPRWQDRLARIVRQTDKMIAIIDHLRAFGRTGPVGAVAVVDLNRAIDDALLLIGAQLRACGIDLVLALAEPSPLVMADTNQIEQILLNLLVNARDVLAPRGEPAPHGASVVLRTERNGATCCLSVTDNGTGIPDHIGSRLFDPFFTTKDVGQGTGLGLSISREIAQRWGGDLTLTNRGDGSGAVARLTLPVAAAAATPSATEAGASR